MRAAALCLLLAASLVGGARPAIADEPCASCDPGRLIDEARQALEGARRWRLPPGGALSPVPPLLAAEQRAQAGRSQDALALGREAASRCLLQGASGCAEAFVLLAELSLGARAGTPGVEDEALAYLSLLPYEELASATCVRAATLRFRLSERAGAGRAKPAWADRCGALGQAGELGYRAAKAALIRNELQEAEERLTRVRQAGGAYAVRATYLVAVLHVARGERGRAERAFREVLSLPPAPFRGEGEDDARTLASLQLARLARERGDNETARALYQGVPPGAVGRAEALLEAAVVAGHQGDLGAARAYLAALESYAPDLGEQLEMRRLRANLAVIDGEEEEALATFRELTAIGREARAELEAAGESLIERLRLDPSLGGLLDPEDARALIALEDELADARALLAEGRAAAQAVSRSLEEGGPDGPVRRALEELQGADALLVRAERLIAMQERSGQTIAGPAEAALALTREARALRTELDRELSRVTTLHAERQRALAKTLVAIEGELDAAEAHLATLVERTQDDLVTLREALVARAMGVVERLEMSEDVGLLELAARRKMRATLEVQRVRREYDQAMATLVSDMGEGKASR